MTKSKQPIPKDQRATVKNPTSKMYIQDKINTAKQITATGGKGGNSVGPSKPAEPIGKVKTGGTSSGPRK